MTSVVRLRAPAGCLRLRLLAGSVLGMAGSLFGAVDRHSEGGVDASQADPSAGGIEFDTRQATVAPPVGDEATHHCGHSQGKDNWSEPMGQKHR